MFNQTGRNAFSPSNQPRPIPVPTGTPSQTPPSSGAQIRPDFIQRTQISNQSSAPTSSSRIQRIKPDEFQRLSPNKQRAALFDQAREQSKAAFQSNYQTLRNPSSSLPGGLSEKQRMDFQMLQRSDPIAAQAKLQQYQRTADIRYNKPGTVPPPAAGAGLTYRRPPTSFNSTKRIFGK